jgi:Galactose oxidase, central domain
LRQKKNRIDNENFRGLQDNGFITGIFSLVRAQQAPDSTFSSVVLGRFQNRASINLDTFESSTGYNIVFETRATNFTKVEIQANGVTRTELGAPYCLARNAKNNFSPAVYLSGLGPKTVTIRAYYGTSVFETFTYNFVLTRGPVPNPLPVSAPVAVPVRSLVPVKAIHPSKQPTNVMYPKIDLLQNRSWVMTDLNAPIEARHEACFLMVGRVAVLIGGRGKRSPNIYNPVTKTWRNGTYPPNNILLHHFQCAAIGNKIWIVSAWTAGFPREQNAPNVFMYDVTTDQWETRAPMPLNRRRGSTAVIAVGNLLYVSHGNSGGHEQSTFATSYTWLDVYNTVTDTWEVLPDARFPRDHTGGALIGDGTKFCVAAGRIGGNVGWPVVPETECYDIPSRTWTVEANIPLPRAGSSYGRSCDGKLLIAGGEGNGKAYAEFDAFDGKKWIKLPNLVQTRHGSGLAVDCVCNAIYIASGNGRAGGGNELYSIETIKFDDKPCAM